MRRSVLELEFVTREGRIGFRRVGVDAASQGSRVFEVMTDKVGRRVEGSVAFVIVEDNEAIFRLMTEYLLQKLVAEHLGSRQGDGFVFFASPQIEESGGRRFQKRRRKVAGFHEDSSVVFVRFKNVIDDLGNG